MMYKFIIILSLIPLLAHAEFNTMCRSLRYPADSCAVMCGPWRVVGYNSLNDCMRTTQCRISCAGSRYCPPCGE